MASISYREEKRIVSDETTNEGVTEGERISVDLLLPGKVETTAYMQVLCN
jgi:hypothetical protein